jgi:hypothetical protein
MDPASNIGKPIFSLANLCKPDPLVTDFDPYFPMVARSAKMQVRAGVHFQLTMGLSSVHLYVSDCFRVLDTSDRERYLPDSDHHPT